MGLRRFPLRPISSGRTGLSIVQRARPPQPNGGCPFGGGLPWGAAGATGALRRGPPGARALRGAWHKCRGAPRGPVRRPRAPRGAPPGAPGRCAPGAPAVCKLLAAGQHPAPGPARGDAGRARTPGPPAPGTHAARARACALAPRRRTCRRRCVPDRPRHRRRLATKIDGLALPSLLHAVVTRPVRPHLDCAGAWQPSSPRAGAPGASARAEHARPVCLSQEGGFPRPVLTSFCACAGPRGGQDALGRLRVHPHRGHQPQDVQARWVRGRPCARV